MPVSLADGAEDGLGDLRAAAHDDEPLAENLVEGFGLPAASERRHVIEDAGDLLLRQPLDLQLDLDQRTCFGLRPAADGTERPDRTAGRGHLRRDLANCRGPVGEVEADGDGGGVLRARHLV